MSDEPSSFDRNASKRAYERERRERHTVLVEALKTELVSLGGDPHALKTTAEILFSAVQRLKDYGALRRDREDLGPISHPSFDTHVISIPVR